MLCRDQGRHTITASSRHVYSLRYRGVRCGGGGGGVKSSSRLWALESRLPYPTAASRRPLFFFSRPVVSPEGLVLPSLQFSIQSGPTEVYKTRKKLDFVVEKTRKRERKGMRMRKNIWNQMEGRICEIYCSQVTRSVSLQTGNKGSVLMRLCESRETVSRSSFFWKRLFWHVYSITLMEGTLKWFFSDTITNIIILSLIITYYVMEKLKIHY